MAKERNREIRHPQEQKETKQFKQDVLRKEKALTEVTGLLIGPKNPDQMEKRRRGITYRTIASNPREIYEEAVDADAGTNELAKLMGMSLTFKRLAAEANC
jgi:hypothetical protein